MTPDQQTEFLEHMRAGMRRGAAAEVMGLTRLEVINFIREHDDFEILVIDAEELATEHVEEALYQAAVSGSVPAAKLWLDLKKPRASTPLAPVTGEEDDMPRDQFADDMTDLLRLTTD